MTKKRFTKEFYKRLDYYLHIDYDEKLYFNKKEFCHQLKDNKFYKNKINIDIEIFPIINKEFIKNNYDQIINQKEVNSYLHTSGTTGSGFIFPVSKHFIVNQWAVFWKFRYIHGLSLDTWCANIISKTMFMVKQENSPYWFKSYSSKQLLLSLYHIRSDSVKEYMDEIKINNIHWLHAYPSVLNNFANLIIDNNLLLEAKQMKLKIITTSSEKLFEYQKQNIKRVFECELRELYGLTEGVVNIFECEKGTLHIDESYSYVELLPLEECANEYKIVGTSYYNSAFPLVRYDTGDTCILYDEVFKCDCGRKSRVVKEILGRDDDYLLLANGSKIGRVSSIFKVLLSIKEAQIFQNKIGSAQFRIVKESSYSLKDEQTLKEKIYEKLGEDFIFEIVYLDKIEKTKSGKLKLVVSEINENK